MLAMHQRVALTLMIALALPTLARAQSTETLRGGVERGLADTFGPPLGVLCAVVVGAFDLYAMGVGLSFAVEQGNGLPAALGGLELGGAAAHLLLGSLLTWAGVEQGDGAYLAIGIPALAFAGWYLVHGIYSLADPGRDPPRARGPNVRAFVAPRDAGGTFEVVGRF